MKSKENKSPHSKPTPAKKSFFSEKKKNFNSLGKARSKALEKLLKAHQYLNGTSPTESRVKKSRGLELAKKLISPAIQRIETISEVLQNMIHLLSTGTSINIATKGNQKTRESADDPSIYLSQSFFDKDQNAQVKQLIQEAANKTQVGDWSSQQWSKVYDCDRSADDFQMPEAWANYIYCLLNLPKDKSEIIIETIPNLQEEEEEDVEEDGGEEENNDGNDEGEVEGGSSALLETDSDTNSPSDSESETNPRRTFLDRLSDFFNP